LSLSCGNYYVSVWTKASETPPTDRTETAKETSIDNNDDDDDDACGICN